MNTDRAAIGEYLTMRRALGFKLAKHERLLTDFVDHLEHTGATTITVDAAMAWATKPATTQPVQWSARLQVVRGFARYLHAVDPAVEVPPANLLPHHHHRPTPYLFAPADIAALLAATGRIRSPLRAATYHAVFGLLAATGIRVGEALRLDDADLDVAAGLLTIRDTKFGKSRRLPLHATTIAALGGYVQERDRRAGRPKTDSLFISTAGTRLIYHNVNTTFRRSVTTAGIGAPSRPRIHDLRHSFAVTTLLRWYRDGGDVQARPLLSAYLGHSHPSSTYWYLQAAPELLALAATRLDHPEAVLS
jgi:integrase/recombinase XerD